MAIVESHMGKPTHNAMDDGLYSYEEVKAILCDACRMGINSTLVSGVSRSEWRHSVNGVEVPCLASDWRLRSGGGKR